MACSLIFLHQYFTPEIAGSAQQLTDLALGLKDLGYSIQVVTGQPSYSTNAKLPRQENFKGVQITRVFKFQFSRDSALGRILSAISFFWAAFFKLFWMDRNAFLVIGSDPPFLPILGWFFWKVRGQRYFLIVSDIYPDVATALGELNPKGWMARCLEWVNQLAYRRAEAIVVLGEKMRERLEAKFHQTNGHSKIRVIHNWADGNWIRPIDKRENKFRATHKLLNQFVVFFSGNMGKVYEFDDVMKTAQLLARDPTFEFLFIGNGPLKNDLEHWVAEKRLNNVHFLPFQDRRDLPFSLTCGDLAVIPLKEEAADFCVPGKIYDALAGGLPLLVIAPEDSDPALITRINDCGWVFPRGNSEAIAELLKKLVKEPNLLEEKKENARACFDRYFTRERAIRQYDSIFSNC